MGVVISSTRRKIMGKSLNFIGKKGGKHEQRVVEKKKKEERKEDFQKFYKSYHIKPAPADWRCSSCDKLYHYKYYSEESDEYYYKQCSNDKVHEEEWKEAAKVDLRRDIVKDFKKQEMVSKNCNKTG